MEEVFKVPKNPLIVGEKYKFTLVKQDFIFLKTRKHMRREKSHFQRKREKLYV